MKLIYIDPQSYNNLALYDKNLLSNMAGINICFMGSVLFEYKVSANVTFLPVFNYSTKKNKVAKLLSYISSIIRAYRYICDFKPDIVHIQWIKFYVIDRFFIALLQKRGIKIVYTAHNVLPHDSGDSQITDYSRLYHLVDRIIVHSINTKNELVVDFKVDSSKVCVIPHGILCYSIEKDIICERVRRIKKMLLLDKQIVFLSMGHQSVYKGSDIIRDVWYKNRYLHDKTKYHLVIVGKRGNIDFSCIENIENVTIIDSYVSDVDFQSYMRIGDVLLMPYRRISQSGVLATAINVHIPIVVSNKGGLTEPLEIADVGWCIGEPGVDSLSHAIETIVSDKKKLYRIKTDESKWTCLEEYYSWNRIGQKTLCLYIDLINGN